MRAVVKHSHGHCKGYIRNGSLYEGPFCFGMQKFHNENHSDIAIRIYRNENKCYNINTAIL